MKGQRLWVGFLLILLGWVALYFLIDGPMMPSPLATIIRLMELLFSGELILHIVYSLYRLFVAIVTALLIGTVSGIIIGMYPKAEGVFAPFIYVMFPVPKAALLPILFVFFGLGDASKIILIYLILYFQVTLSVYDGVKSIPESFFLSAATLQLKGLNLYRHVVLPAILPSVFTSLRVSVGIGIAVLFFAETYATHIGLGYFIMNQWSLLNYEAMYAGIILLGAIGYVIFRGIDALRNKLAKWT